MIKLGDDETDICEVGRGVRQGRLLSPLVFSISVENILIEAMDGRKRSNNRRSIGKGCPISR
jgi:hypothetical protein